MKTNYLSKYLLLLFMFMNLTTKNFAQENINARSVALGGCSANLDDEWSAFNNPAGSSALNGFSAGINYNINYLAKELSHQSVVMNCSLKNYGVTSFAYSQFGYELYRENEFLFGFSKTFGDKVAAGLVLNYSRIHFGDELGNTSMLKCKGGVQIKITDNLKLAIVIDNPFRPRSSSFTNERSATVFETGLNYKFSNKLASYIQADLQSGTSSGFRFSLEYMPLKNFYLRGGISGSPLSESFGFGYTCKNLHVDLGTSYHQILGFSPVLSLLYNFSK